MKKIYICPIMTVQQMNPTDVLMNSGINLVESGDGGDNPIFGGAKDREEEMEMEIAETKEWGSLW